MKGKQKAATLPSVDLQILLIEFSPLSGGLLQRELLLPLELLKGGSVCPVLFLRFAPDAIVVSTVKSMWVGRQYPEIPKLNVLAVQVGWG